jgi:HTH-type transcriptional regulator / antitoxin HigA
MAKTATAPPLDSYMALVRRHPLRPVRSEADWKRATAVIQSLTAHELDAGESEYLDTLSDLVWIYEEEHHQIDDLSPREALASLIEDRGISQRSLAGAVEIPVSTISEILSGKREFNIAHIDRLAAYFQVSPAVFMTTMPKQSPPPTKARRRKL